LVEGPVLRLLLLALMGLALASRLALGATLPVANAGDDALSKLQAAMIICHAGPAHKPLPTPPQGPLLSDLLLLGQADNAHALASNPVVAVRLSLRFCEVDFVAVHAAGRPLLWRAVRPARGPPAAV
jgi:hypothetical protein